MPFGTVFVLLFLSLYIFNLIVNYKSQKTTLSNKLVKTNHQIEAVKNLMTKQVF